MGTAGRTLKVLNRRLVVVRTRTRYLSAMSRQDDIDDLIQWIAAARDSADELGLEHAVYLLNVAMLAVLERDKVNPTPQDHSVASGMPY
jgi:hypothetical protein